jgi:hypothetical protein
MTHLCRSTAWSALLVVALTSWACGSDDPSVPPMVESVSLTLTPNPVTLANTAQGTVTVTPSGAAEGVTWSSEDEEIATVSSAGLVTPLRTGSVEITATSTANPSISGSVILAIECPDPRLVTTIPQGDTTWENWISDRACFDYVVQTNVIMQDGLLTIEPGTVVGFEEERNLRINIDAGIHAEGTEENPITLTGVTKERGFWEGVGLEATGRDDHVIAWTTIEYAEGFTFGPGPAGLLIGNGVTAELIDNTFRQNAGYGMAIEFDADLTTLRNVMTENALGPAILFAGEAEHLSFGGDLLLGNDIDEVVVLPEPIDFDTGWPRATYRIRTTNGAFWVTGESGLLSLTPGSVLRFEEDGALRVRDGGGLYAVGTEELPIVFTGTEAVPGHWYGLSFEDSDHVANELVYVEIAYAGGSNLNDIDDGANLALIYSGTPSKVKVSNTTIRGSAGYGLFLEARSSVEGFENNTLTQNMTAPAAFSAPAVGDILTGNDFTGNSVDEVVVLVGSGNYVLDESTEWNDAGVPYAVTIGNMLTVQDAALTLSPGVEVLFGPDKGVLIDGASAFLSAEGTEQDRIVLASHTAPWQGIAFQEGSGRFDYIDIHDGGSVAWGQVGGEAGNVTIISPSVGPPTPNVFFTGEVSWAGSQYFIVFGPGDTIAQGCPGNIYIPPPDEVTDHCRPPG